MARIPGTETPTNRAGFRPGDVIVGGPRARALADLGLGHRPGLVTEVRSGHVRVTFEPGRAGLWLTSDGMIAAEALHNPELDLVRQALRLLNGVRVEFDEDDVLTVYSTGVDADAIDAVRQLFGPRLLSLRIAPEGVHELAVALRLPAE
jgi:hypothetical protein